MQRKNPYLFLICRFSLILLLSSCGLGKKIAGNRDYDKDGVVNKNDSCCQTPGLVQLSGCPDIDGDGVPDFRDDELNSEKNAWVDARGVMIDVDQDGVPDYRDEERNSEKGALVDANGVMIDRDKDGIPDYRDEEPDSEKGSSVDDNGVMIDRDNDGVPDYRDEEPNTANGSVVDSRGVAVPRNGGTGSDGGFIDTDGDGIPDEEDYCPNVAGLTKWKGCSSRLAMQNEERRRGEIPPLIQPPQHSIPDPIVSSDEIDPSKATITYSYKNKVVVNEAPTIRVLMQLDKTMEELEDAMREEINRGRDGGQSLDVARTDTTIIKSAQFYCTDCRFFVEVNCNPEIFEITKVDSGDQTLSKLKPAFWSWRIKALKKTPVAGSEITLTVKSRDENGEVTFIDNGTFKILVEVQDPIDPNPNPTFFEKYKYIFTGAIIALILAALIFFFYKKRAAGVSKQTTPIYFSYAWGNEGENIVDQLYNSLKKDEFNVIRDKVNLKYKGKISNFMHDIGSSDFVILAISDKYLKSNFCMFEFYELYRNSKMDKDILAQKIFPIRVEDIRLDKPEVLNHYIDYWQKQEAEWSKLIQENGDTVTDEQFKQFQAIKRIVNDLGTLLSVLADINALSIEQLSANDFQEMKVAIRKALDEKFD